MSQLDQGREEVECKLEGRKQEPDIQGKGSSKCTYMERRMRVASLGPKSPKWLKRWCEMEEWRGWKLER